MAKNEEKKDFHVDMSKLVEQVKKNFHKLTSDAGTLAKQGEKELVKASSIGKLQLDIMGINMQKEKLYYEIGKAIATSRKENMEKTLEPFMKKIRAFETEIRKKKQEISNIKKPKATK
ncbi:MAG: hypothetical protein PHQ52_06535 [Candidatus Omnitrophica bacterium]|nr:hypothetical protein [Candidatus Omnitrophota bacterium]